MKISRHKQATSPAHHYRLIWTSPNLPVEHSHFPQPGRSAQGSHPTNSKHHSLAPVYSIFLATSIAMLLSPPQNNANVPPYFRFTPYGREKDKIKYYFIVLPFLNVPTSSPAGPSGSCSCSRPYPHDHRLWPHIVSPSRPLSVRTTSLARRLENLSTKRLSAWRVGFPLTP